MGIRTNLGLGLSLQELSNSPDPVDSSAARMFPLLGALDGSDFSLSIVAQLLDRSEDETERALERLADAQLLETSAPGRYRIHDLVRLYARTMPSTSTPNQTLQPLVPVFVMSGGALSSSEASPRTAEVSGP